MTDYPTPEILSITRDSGIAGQYAYRVTVRYGDESPEVTRFYGSVYGGPIVAEWAESGSQVFVSAAVLDRCGRMLTPEWVRAFYAGPDPSGAER